MAPTSKAVPQRQIKTRASNKSVHPGNVCKPAVPRRTSAQVQQEREAKAKAKSVREEARQQSIIRTAEFEHADMANEDMVDATPRPPFTSKRWPPPRNHKSAKLVPVTGSSDVEMSDNCDKASSAPASSEQSVAEDESAIERGDPTPPAKRQKQATEKATRTAGGKEKVAEKKKEVGGDEEIVLTSDEEQTPKPKKVKVKLRDDINFAAKKIEEDEVKGNKYGNMLKSVSSKPAAEQSGGMPVPKVPLRARGGKKLKREGAIADIKALCKRVTPETPDQSSQDNMSQNDINFDVMDIDNRQLFLSYSCFHY
jgi:hypothetical protein